MMIRAINYALLGISRNMHQAQQSARNISTPGEGAPRPSRISGEFVEMMKAKRAVEANIAALKAADRTLGSLVNVRA
ncbi:MAG: hypothetical protein GF417_09780 [Candidatus Latescibacteria bacterium]|nr:hypothetical protein [bacterium]MBD3424715.1 hypothetical protein [Candidatus Latescibacterota bacterium]